jgi:TRAP-type mannitol/chloroaromatic compound transport system substrate-binding protein
MFSSNYSNSNPFSFNNKTTSSIEDSLLQTYAQLEALKAKQTQLNNGNLNQQDSRNVFTDISDEFKDLTEDEVNFIVNSPEYKSLNEKYQNEFSQFLISKFSNEYLQTGNARTLEEMLHTVKKKKEDFKQKFSKDINEIRDMNKELLEKNNALAASNLELQEQIKTLLKGI